MTQIKRILILLMATLVMTEVAVEAKRPAILNQADEKAMNEWVNATFSKMTPDEKIAHCFRPMPMILCKRFRRKWLQ